MKVHFFKPSIDDEELNAVNRVLKSGWLTTGPETHAFEREFASFIGSKFAVAVNSCTAALHLALEISNIKRGDLVLIPTFTFAATAGAVEQVGAIPIFVDSKSNDFCMDPIEVEQLVKSFGIGHVKAIIPVHVAGQVGPLKEILNIAHKYNVTVIEDAAHTLPAYWRESSNTPWIHAGTSGLGCFSFYANKPITTGEGGMLVTDDEELALRARRLSLHGLDTDAWDRFNNNVLTTTDIVEPGFKYNLTDIASALGRVQLKRAKDLWERRIKIALTYNEQLKDLAEELELPSERVNRLHSWCLYIVKVKKLNRDLLVQKLRLNGVHATIHWRPLHLQTCYKSQQNFHVATDLGNRVMSLPLYAGMTESEVDFVVSTIKKVIKEWKPELS